LQSQESLKGKKKTNLIYRFSALISINLSFQTFILLLGVPRCVTFCKNNNLLIVFQISIIALKQHMHSTRPINCGAVDQWETVFHVCVLRVPVGRWQIPVTMKI